MKVAIVGGGLGGLTAALLFAERGAQVTVFERSRELGGRARTTNENGFLLNLGPHAIYRGGPAERLLTRIGAKPIGAPPRTKGFVAFEGKLHTLPTGPLSLLTTGFLDPGGRWEAARFLARIGSATADGDETVGAWLSRSVRHERVRALLRMLMMVATYTHPVDALRARDALAQLKTAVSPGVLYLDHGWGTLVDAVSTRADALGVSFETSARVAHVVSEAGTARALAFEDGSETAFDGIVLATGPHTAAKLAPQDDAIARAEARSVPVEAACLDVALECMTCPATVLFGADEPYYASVHSTAATLVPPGSSGAVVHVVKYLAPGAAATEAELREVLERLQPGAIVAHARFLPRLVVMNARVNADLGGIDGRIHAPSTNGLALVGDWVGSRGLLLDAVMASAEDAVERLAPSRAAAKSA